MSLGRAMDRSLRKSFTFLFVFILVLPLTCTRRTKHFEKRKSLLPFKMADKVATDESSNVRKESPFRCWFFSKDCYGNAERIVRKQQQNRSTAEARPRYWITGKREENPPGQSTQKMVRKYGRSWPWTKDSTLNSFIGNCIIVIVS